MTAPSSFALPLPAHLLPACLTATGALSLKAASQRLCALTAAAR